MMWWLHSGSKKWRSTFNSSPMFRKSRRETCQFVTMLSMSWICLLMGYKSHRSIQDICLHSIKIGRPATKSLMSIWAKICWKESVLKISRMSAIMEEQWSEMQVDRLSCLLLHLLIKSIIPSPPIASFRCCICLIEEHLSSGSGQPEI